MKTLKKKSVALFAKVMVAVAAARIVFSLKKTLSLILWVIMLSLSACEDQTKMNPYVFSKVDQLKASSQITLYDILGYTAVMSVYDDNLVLFNRRTSKHINIFDLNTGDLKNSYLKTGQGPDELVSPSNIQMQVYRDSITVEDYARRRLYNYEINDDPKLESQYTFVNLPKDGLFFKSHHIKDSIFLHMTQDPDIMYELTIGDESRKPFFSYPRKDDKVSRSLAYAYQGSFIPNKDKTKFFYASGSSDIFELYGFDGVDLTKIKRYQTRYPVFIDKTTSDSYSVSYPSDSDLGFRSSTATEKYIYLLYSGRDRVTYPESYAYANEIYVIDWDGALIRKFILDTDVFTICVNKDDSKLYGIKDSEDGSIVVAYDLNL